MSPRTPEQWRDHLIDKLDAQNRYHAIGDAYYRGNHPLPDAPAGARGEFLRLMRLARSNWCELIVDAVAERLVVDGVRFGNGADADLDIWQTIWQPNGLDAEHGQVHTEALIGGTASVLVWPAEAPGEPPVVSVEHPSEVYVAGGGSYRQRRRAAIKRYTVDDDELVTVQLDGAETADGRPMVYKWHREAGEREWTPHADAGDPGPSFVNPLGVVSFIPFNNKRRMIGAGVSELDGGITDIQDRINETLFNRITAARFAAFRQRWMTGMDIPVDPETGKPIEPFRAAIDRLWMAEDKDTTFGEFSATDLRPFIDSVEADIQHLAAISRTPPHYLLGQSGAFPSGESLKATETGLVAKVEARALAFGESWEQVIRLALGAMEDARAADTSLEVVWRDPESKNIGELVDALVKLGSLGVPNEALWQQYGATPQEVARWRAQAARAALAGPAATPRTSPPAVPAPQSPAADPEPAPAAEEPVPAQ